jgi:hypothetical protein
MVLGKEEVDMRTRTETIGTAYAPATIGSPSPQRIRWGAVFGGAVLGLAFLALLTALWLTLAYATGVDIILDNLEWFIGGSAIGCLFIAGLIAGWMSGVHGSGSGLLNGVTIWGLMLLIGIGIGLPATLNVLNLGRITAIDEATGNWLTTADDTVLWATFFSIVGGLVAAGLGGAIGGALARPANAELAAPATTEMIDRPARPDLGERTVVVPATDDEDVVRYRHRVP